MERRRFVVHRISQGWRLVMVMSTRSIVGGHRFLREVGGMRDRTSIGEWEVWKVNGQLLWGDFDEFTSSVGHPPIETFPSILDSELAMIQMAVKLIPEFLQNPSHPVPCLGLIAFDLYSFESVLAIY
jgi:hypothetical protein